MHLFDVLLRLVYLGAFLHFAILPPIPSTESTQPMAPQFREYLIVLYAASQLFRPWGLVNTPYILVFLAFLSCLPSVPFPQDYAYSVLLAALCLDILQLHFPIYPTPILLLPPNQALPLSVLIAHGTFKIFLPVILFFLPAILLASFLLSISLSDTFLPIFTLTTLEPSPLEARMAFLSLLTITFILLICSLAMLILVYPTLSSQGPQNSWDRYSKSIGLDARRRFASTVVTYSEPHFFPPPLHVIRVVFLAPSLVLPRLPRWKDWQPWLNGLEAVLWRILVLPGALVVAGFWGWGLSQ